MQLYDTGRFSKETSHSLEAAACLDVAFAPTLIIETRALHILHMTLTHDLCVRREPLPCGVTTLTHTRYVNGTDNCEGVYCSVDPTGSFSLLFKSVNRASRISVISVSARIRFSAAGPLIFKGSACFSAELLTRLRPTPTPDMHLKSNRYSLFICI